MVLTTVGLEKVMVFFLSLKENSLKDKWNFFDVLYSDYKVCTYFNSNILVVFLLYIL